MNEQQARDELQGLLNLLHKKFKHFTDHNLAGASGKVGYVEHHINRMYKEFGGEWDENKAIEYITTLTSEVNQMSSDR